MSATALLDGLSGQAAHSQAITDQSAERYGESSSVQSSGKSSTVHPSGYPTNSAADPLDKAILTKAVIIIVIAAALLVFEGAIVFRNHNL